MIEFYLYGMVNKFVYKCTIKKCCVIVSHRSVVWIELDDTCSSLSSSIPPRQVSANTRDAEYRGTFLDGVT